jgi:hypothetical protein
VTYSNISISAAALDANLQYAKRSDFRLRKNRSVGALSQQSPFLLMLGII